MTSRVLHVQTADGISGGIAGYISVLIQYSSSPEVRQYVVVPEAAKDMQRAQRLFGPGSFVSMPPSYTALTFPSYVLALRDAVRKHRISVVHAHALRSGVACAILSMISRTSYVYTNHGIRYTQKRSPLSRLVFAALEYLVCARANTVVSVRSSDARTLKRRKWINSDKVELVPTRLPFEQPPQTARRQMVLGVGSLIEVKRPDRFIDWVSALFRLHPGIQARWVGGGPLLEWAREESVRRGISIDWYGQVDSTEVRQHVAESSLLLLTSDFEVMPLSVLEAYSCGVPVIATNFDGVQDFVDTTSGLVVDAKDANAVAEQIKTILTTPGRLAVLAKRAEQRFQEEFSDPAVMSSKYHQLYSRIRDRHSA